MTGNIGLEAQPNAKSAWSVVVIYDDAAGRERAVDFCDQLVKRFWARFEFEVSWWSFGLLQKQASVAMDAAQKAARADLVVLSSATQEDLPVGIKTWIESWLACRDEREGILAGLLGAGVGCALEVPQQLYLRQVAHRAGMDYLTQVPQSISRCLAESAEAYNVRAAQVTRVLDEILHQSPPAPLMN